MKIMMTCLAALFSLSVASAAQASYGGSGARGYASNPRASAKKSAAPRAKKNPAPSLAKKKPKGGAGVASSGGYGGGYGGGGGY